MLNPEEVHQLVNSLTDPNCNGTHTTADRRRSPVSQDSNVCRLGFPCRDHVVVLCLLVAIAWLLKFAATISFDRGGSGPIVHDIHIIHVIRGTHYVVRVSSSHTDEAAVTAEPTPSPSPPRQLTEEAVHVMPCSATVTSQTPIPVLVPSSQQQLTEPSHEAPQPSPNLTRHTKHPTPQPTPQSTPRPGPNLTPYYYTTPQPPHEALRQLGVKRPLCPDRCSSRAVDVCGEEDGDSSSSGTRPPPVSSSSSGTRPPPVSSSSSSGTRPPPVSSSSSSGTGPPPVSSSSSSGTGPPPVSSSGRARSVPRGLKAPHSRRRRRKLPWTVVELTLLRDIAQQASTGTFITPTQAYAQFTHMMSSNMQSPRPKASVVLKLSDMGLLDKSVPGRPRVIPSGGVAVSPALSAIRPATADDLVGGVAVSSAPLGLPTASDLDDTMVPVPPSTPPRPPADLDSDVVMEVESKAPSPRLRGLVRPSADPTEDEDMDVSPPVSSSLRTSSRHQYTLPDKGRHVRLTIYERNLLDDVIGFLKRKSWLNKPKRGVQRWKKLAYEAADADPTLRDKLHLINEEQMRNYLRQAHPKQKKKKKKASGRKKK